MSEKTMKINDVEKFFDEYYGFDDGVVKSFDYIFSEDGVCSVSMCLYACNYELGGGEWKKVTLLVQDVCEARSTIIPVTIHSKIKILKFNDGFGLEVNTDFGLIPVCLESVRKYSTCYVLGGSVEVFESEWSQ
ncbi:hypothetical protein [Pseudomonas sp. NPDC089401]|uniref:hypothetical protein n=1 Tax=Pseudomonas sp. NPDC089401 TaxID=3364462 RepID=UPI0038102F24